jgi:queuosine precursor transporter
MQRRILPSALFAAFVATVPAANWMIGNVGSCIPDGPCLIPVGFGWAAPSGVLMVGAAMVLRDAIHERLGAVWALLAIFIGCAVSAFLAPPALVLASGAAFLLAELADFAVYTPLRKRSLTWAVLASGAVGSVIDSAVFLLLAFGSLQYIEGQILGKLWMSLAAVVVLKLIRNQHRATARI